jgi:hypothetical protein
MADPPQGMAGQVRRALIVPVLFGVLGGRIIVVPEAPSLTL